MKHSVQQARQYAEDNMKLFIQSTMIFFGTLLAAALVALGQPAAAEVQMTQAATPPAEMVVSLLGLHN
jgi:heme/copper-type cytochrome/quinol oxidase subunit 3